MAHSQHSDIGLITLPGEDFPTESDGLRAMPEQLTGLFRGLSGEIHYLVIESNQLAALIFEKRPPLSQLLKATVSPVGEYDFEYLFTSSGGITPSLTPAQILEETKKHGGEPPQGQLPDRKYRSVSILRVSRSEK